VRSYKQHCGLAKALDVIGDRWTLLIVRELLIRKSCRYTDLRNGLPGIATNLLADRLRELEQTGIISREDAPPPVATTLYQLTVRGRDLESIILQLGKWGAPLLKETGPGDAFSSHWLALPLKLFVRDRSPEAPPQSIEIRAGGEPVTVQVAHGEVDIRLGRAKSPDAVIIGGAMTILALMAGKLDLATAEAAGVIFEGNLSVLRRVANESPRAAVTSPS
jgi:DNA-binding HxlR family transcriptional regulator